VCDGSKVELLREPWHIICLLLNIFLPGTGTIISAFGWTQDRKGRQTHVEMSFINFATVFDGVMQLLLSVILIGWIWSILFGYSIYCKRKYAPRP
jgi:cytochrome bd-type quinol oxidase subunit 1